MLAMATFYRNIESLFDGVLTIRNNLEVNISPVGYVRTTGKDKLRVHGVANSVTVTEEIATRISSYIFSHIDYIEPVAATYTGKVLAVDAGGIGIPVNKTLFTLPVEMALTYLSSMSPIRDQDEPGTIPADKVVNFVIKYSVANTLLINDYLIVTGKRYVIKNCYSPHPSRWLIQTVLREL